jgi:hypothetical protein
MILNKIRSQYIYIFIYFNKIDEKYIKKHKDKKKMTTCLDFYARPI